MTFEECDGTFSGMAPYYGIDVFQMNKLKKMLIETLRGRY